MADFAECYERLALYHAEVYVKLRDAYRSLLVIPVELPVMENAQGFIELAEDVARAALLLLDLPDHIQVIAALQRATWNWLSSFHTLMVFKQYGTSASYHATLFTIRSADRDLVAASTAREIPEPPDLDGPGKP